MIHETIVTTLSPDGTIHPAPMGVRIQDGALILAPFRPCRTLENLERARQAVVNYCDDVRVFAGCVTGRREWPTRPAARVRCGYLEQALAHAEIEITHIEEHELRPRVVCNVVHEEIHAPFRGFNRAQGAVIEAAILVSRLHILPADKVARELGYLSIALEKTAGPREREAWGWLMARIETHLEQFAGAQ